MKLYDSWKIYMASDKLEREFGRHIKQATSWGSWYMPK